MTELGSGAEPRVKEERSAVAGSPRATATPTCVFCIVGVEVGFGGAKPPGFRRSSSGRLRNN